MKNNRILLGIVLIVLSTSFLTTAQTIGGYGSPLFYDRNSFFILAGYLQGPNFEKYIDWANQYYSDEYGSTERLDDFGGSFCLSIGLRSRFSRYFAFEVDFLTSSKNTEQGFTITGGAIEPQDLDLTVGAISFSVPILFQFSNRQPVIPFVAAGATVFPLRLDHSIYWGIRHTKTALAGNFAAGLESEIFSRWWITGRIDWTFGKANMPVTQIIGGDDKYEINLTTTQFQVGVMRGIY